MVQICIDAYSDLACPWCYVGKGHLDNAISQFTSSNPTTNIIVNWHPYIIDKNTAENGEKYINYNVRRWGGDGWTQSLRNSGRQIGLEFKNWQIWPNTLHAHRVVHLAGVQKGPAGQNMAKNVLFRMIYEEGENISDIDILIKAAGEIGLGRADSYLRSDEDVDIILFEDSQAKSKLRISGVPLFKIRGGTEVDHRPIVLSGAQQSGQFFKAFQTLMGD
ncbi:predicted protein [Nematostella vectensis]|uniref:DSBA-like thioredoxin domain-containing protein n=1 Tax=Nematostella vectensis TaxID=45351 RepID=A7S8S9_NEMVE|nr:predicted protein [Nematostella vectensis]|eukprot:XP_001631984.1 predicted protein [Nematostella vectensis]